MKHDLRWAASLPGDLDVAPADPSCPRPQRLHHRLLGGETAGQLRRSPAAVSGLALRVDPSQEPIAVPVRHPLDPGAKPCKDEEKCKDFPNRKPKNENKGQRKCSDIPGLTMDLESMEDIKNENGEKVGFIIKTKTVLTFDQPGQGHKKTNPNGEKETRKSWDKIQLNKPENPGRDKSNNSKAKGQAQNQNNAAFFPALAVNDDNDCTRDSDGEHFGGPNVVDGTDESCFDGGGLLRDGFTELKDEDPVDEINDDNDCKRDSDGEHFGGIDVEDGTDDSCFDDDGLLKDGLTLLIDEDTTEDGIDQDGDGQDGEDPLNQIDNDGDGLFDEDGPNGTFEDACVDPEVGGILIDGQCDLTGMVISKTNEKTKEMTFNPDNDCVDAGGNRLGELKDNFGSVDSCFDGDGNLKQTVQPLDGEVGPLAGVRRIL